MQTSPFFGLPMKLPWENPYLRIIGALFKKDLSPREHVTCFRLFLQQHPNLITNFHISRFKPKLTGLAAFSWSHSGSYFQLRVSGAGTSKMASLMCLELVMAIARGSLVSSSWGFSSSISLDELPFTVILR